MVGIVVSALTQSVGADCSIVVALHKDVIGGGEFFHRRAQCRDTASGVGIFVIVVTAADKAVRFGDAVLFHSIQYGGNDASTFQIAVFILKVGAGKDTDGIAGSLLRLHGRRKPQHH